MANDRQNEQADVESGLCGPSLNIALKRIRHIGMMTLGEIFRYSFYWHAISCVRSMLSHGAHTTNILDVVVIRGFIGIVAMCLCHHVSPNLNFQK